MSPTVAAKPIATVKPTSKPPFKSVDLSQIPMSRRNEEVKIDFDFVRDANVYPYEVLATALWNDRKSQVFQLQTTEIALSSQISSTIRYNRRKKLFLSYDWSSMAGPGMLSESRTICRNVSDAVIFKLAARKALGNLKQSGCSCTTTDLLKAKNHQNKSAHQ